MLKHGMILAAVIIWQSATFATAFDATAFLNTLPNGDAARAKVTVAVYDCGNQRVCDDFVVFFPTEVRGQ